MYAVSIFAKLVTSLWQYQTSFQVLYMSGVLLESSDSLTDFLIDL